MGGRERRRVERVGIEMIVLTAMPVQDEQAMVIFSRMFIFSSLLVAGFVAVMTRQRGVRRWLASGFAFALSYAAFWLILHKGV